MNVYIRTFGCQMNLYDSELVSTVLKNNGFTLTDNEADADAVLVTGCTVREHADTKAFNYLSQVTSRKKKESALVVGLIGCLGQRIVNERADPVSGIDFYLGPDAYRQLPALLRELPAEKHVEARNPLEDYDDIPPLRKAGAGAWLAISRGCDNACTYCIVPTTRGAERSRPADSIVREVRSLVGEGYREVTLLGQNVNSYDNDGSRFPELLGRVAAVPGIRRVRFTTSHPMDMSEDLVYAIRDHDTVCNHIHLPVQSGSDRILRNMGREYTVKQYRSLTDRIKREIPGASITTDIISGFPGETEDDHRKTLDLVRYVEYDSAFTFKYSPRTGTPAAQLEDDVPDGVKVKRLSEISTLQREITQRRNQRLIGGTVEVMIETTSKRSPYDALGKTDTFKNVVVSDCTLEPGTFCTVRIGATSSQTLFGSVVSVENTHQVMTAV